MQGLSGLAFTPLLPVALLAALTALSVAVVAYGAWARARGMAWRAVVLAAGLVALLNPTLVDERRESLPDVAVLVIDSTASQDIGARRAQTAKAADAVRARLASMDDLELRVVTVAADSGADGSLLFAALAKALSDVPADRVAGAILITDGQVHDAPEVADTVAHAGPVHVLLTGERDERDRRLVIEQAPSYGIVGDRLSVTVLVDDPGAAGQMAELTVRVAGQRARRAAVEPVIGHVKAEHRMERNFLKGRDGDRANAVLAAAGYNFSLLIRWFEDLLRALITTLLGNAKAPQTA